MALRVNHSGKEVQATPIDEQLVFQGLEGFAERNGLNEPLSDAKVADSRCIW
jgi:hypothetical protein